MKRPSWNWRGALVTAVITLVAGGLGSLLTTLITNHFQEARRSAEIRERSYARLLAVRDAWAQAIESEQSFDVLFQYHWNRFHLLKDSFDREQAVRYLEKQDRLIEEISACKREALSALGESRSHFRFSSDTEKLIADLERMDPKRVEEPSVASEDALEEWTQEQLDVASRLPDRELRPTINKILEAMLKHVGER